MIYINTNIKHKREQLSWSQEFLARRVGCSQKNINSYENAGINPSYARIIKIAEALQVTIHALVTVDLRVQPVESVVLYP